jgi:hypothetical protein
MDLPLRSLRSSAFCARCAVALVVASAAVGTPVAAAQDAEWRTVESPYQEDLRVAVGTTFAPGVEIDGVRWRSLRIAPAEGETVAAGETVQTEVSLELENRGNKTVQVLVILLLEDEDGAPLDRIEAIRFKVGGGRLKERTETVALSGDALLETRRVYALCEITR